MEPLEPIKSTTSLKGLNLDLLELEEPRHKFLRFALGATNSGLLLLEQISEVLHLDLAEILPVPDMPSCVLGIYNWRGKMLWLVDLDHLVDYPPLFHQGRLELLTVIVIEINSQSMGLVVRYVNDIELHDPAQLQSAAPGLFPPKLLPFIQGYLPGTNGTVLDPEAIARSPLWQIHRS